jgi:Concanavalin A-like lectin/glucanases superfamily
MSRLTLKAPWTSQPQIAVGVDWSNPLAYGLLSAWTPATGLVLRAGGVTSPVGATPDQGFYGKGRTFNGTSDSMSLGENALSHTAASRFALIKVGSAVGPRNISAGGIGGLGFRLNDTAIEVVNTGVIVLLSAAGSVSAGQLCSVGCSYKTSDTRIYRNGAQIASAIIGGVLTDNNTDFFGQNGASAQYFDGTLFLHLSWDRALSDAEQLSINTNPWQIFAPIQRKIWVPISGGNTTADGSITGTATVTGTGASIAAAAGSITGTVTVTGAGAATQAAAFNAAGVLNMTGEGTTASNIVSADGSISAAATVTGTAQATQGAAGSVTGILLPTGTGAATQAAAGTIAGTLAMTGAGASSGGIVSAAGSITAGLTMIGKNPQVITTTRREGRRRTNEDDDELLDLAYLIMPLLTSGALQCRA